MTVRERELQLISVERTSSSPRTYAGQSALARTKRRKRRRKRQRLRATGFLCAAAILLVAVCYRTNWFTEFSVFGNRAGRLVREMQRKPADYPQELQELLEQNEETYDFVENYINRERYQGKEIDLSDSYETGSVPLLMQWDKRWGYDLYGNSMIGLAGCGPTCMTMAYLYYTGDLTMNPRKMAEYAQDKGYHSEEGTSWSFWTDGAAGLGLYGEQISLSENAMKAVLDCGGLLVCSMSPGDFTTKGHFILLRGYDKNGFFVNDPNRKSNSNQQWDYDTLSGQIKNLWAIYSG